MSNFSAEPLGLPEVLLIRGKRHGDARGWFTEIYVEGAFQALGIHNRFVQDNLAMSAAPGTVRGLHAQAPPASQAKLIRAVTGAVFDVVVDIRRDSPRYGRWCSVRLDAAEGHTVYVPHGFAHGYCTLEPGSQLSYKVDGPFAPQLELGIRWDDPDLAIAWPEIADPATVSPKDRGWPLLAEFRTPFSVDGPL